jgi:hypothetical protein
MLDVNINLKDSNQLGLLNLIGWSILAALAVFIFRSQIGLLSYLEWGDESETIVTAKMIAAGGLLYSDIFNHHGPLTFLSGLIIEKLHNSGVSAHRIPIIILQWIALASIYLSPLLKYHISKSIYAGLSGAIMVLYFPSMNGHTYIYQAIVGLILIIILAQYTLPAIATPEKIRSTQIVIGNLLIGSLPFFSITYLPISGLLFIASIRKPFSRIAIYAMGMSILASFIFLASIGSIVGYLAFHLYLNANILPLYNEGQTPVQLVVRAFSSATHDLSSAIIFLSNSLAIASIAIHERKFPWRAIFIGVGLGSLLIRGIEFHGLPYFYASLAFPLTFLINQPTPIFQSTFISLGVSVIFIAKLFLSVGLVQRPDKTEFSNLVQAVTSKEDKIIAYSFANFEYLAADRLPASGNFFYLPWQEKYNENPKYGIKIDSCEDIKKYKPKIMLIDKWLVWGKHSWDSYAGCVQSIIDNDYSQVGYKPYYFRNDAQPTDIIYKTDNTWSHGIARQWSGFYVLNTKKMASTYKAGNFVKFSNGEIREILRTIDNGVLLNVYTSGNPLDADKVGSPNTFIVVENASINSPSR